MQEVADALGVSKQMISKYEKGLSLPNSHKIIKLAQLFSIKVDYFFSQNRVELGEINFRKKASFSLKKQNALKESIKNKLENFLYLENILSIDKKFENPIRDLNISLNGDIIKAAQIIRNEWNMGLSPIHDMIQLFEDHGIIIIEIEEKENKFDGLATFVNNKYPVIVLNKLFVVERKRFSLAHELGHLLLSISPTSLNKEAACNMFASELLLPKQILIEAFGGKRRHISFNELKAMQIKYGLSIKAIIYRLVDVGILNENQHKNFYKKLRADKNAEIKIDQSRFSSTENSSKLETMAYRALSQELISLSKASSLLNKNIDLIRNNLAII